MTESWPKLGKLTTLSVQNRAMGTSSRLCRSIALSCPNLRTFNFKMDSM